MGNWTSGEDWTEFTDTKAGREAMLDVILEAAGIIDEKCELTPPNNLTTFANRLGQEWVNSAGR